MTYIGATKIKRDKYGRRHMKVDIYGGEHTWGRIYTEKDTHVEGHMKWVTYGKEHIQRRTNIKGDAKRDIYRGKHIQRRIQTDEYIYRRGYIWKGIYIKRNI